VSGQEAERAQVGQGHRFTRAAGAGLRGKRRWAQASRPAPSCPEPNTSLSRF